jgi:peptidylprolyl isomerase
VTTPRTLAAVLLASTLALTACGDDNKDVASSQSSNAYDSGADSGAGSGDTSTGGSAAAGSDVGFTMPAVTANATDLTKEPKAGKGSGAGPATVQTKDLVVGKGTAAKLTDTVTVHYVGSLYSDGSVFDSSWEGGGRPIAFPLNPVVPGFAQGIKGMRIGGRRIIVIPAALGYGPADQPGIPANSVLVFIVDLKKIT